MLCALIGFNSVSANVFYYYMERCNRQSYAMALELSTRIHAYDDGSIKDICIGGYIESWKYEDYVNPEVLGSLGRLKNVNKTLLNGPRDVCLYLFNEIGFELSYYKMNEDAQIPVWPKKAGEPVADGWTLQFPVVSDEEGARIMQTEQYRQMPCWPAAGCVSVMGDTIVVKLSQDSAH